MTRASELFGGGSGINIPGAGGFQITQTNLYMGPAIPISAQAATATVADYIMFTPFVAKKAVTVKAIMIENTGAGDSGDKCRVGLWQANAFGMPGTLLQQSGEITFAGAAALNDGTITATTLTPGVLYWAGAVLNASVTIRTINGTSLAACADYPPIMVATGAPGNAGCMRASFAYGVLGNTPTITENGFLSAQVAYLMLKVN